VGGCASQGGALTKVPPTPEVTHGQVTRLMTEKIKPEAFIRYFVAVKNNWPAIYFYRLC